jgi:hypothetical protein
MQQIDTQLFFAQKTERGLLSVTPGEARGRTSRESKEEGEE